MYAGIGRRRRLAPSDTVGTMSRYSIDIRHLRYFVAIAEAGSFTRAAALLHIAQPALSQHVRNLELEFDAQLLTRGPRGVDLTPEGQKLLTHALRVLDEMDQLLDAVAAGPPEGDVQLGLTTPVSWLVTKPLLTIMQRDYRGVTLNIREGMSSHLTEWLTDGRLDAAVLFSDQNLPHLEYRDVCAEPLYVVGAPGAFALRDVVPLRELHRYPLIMPNWHNGPRELVHRTTQAHGVGYTIKFEIDVLGELKRFVESGTGYSVLAPIAFYEDLVAGRLSAAPIVAPEIVRTWTLATRQNRKRNAACRTALDLTESVLIERTQAVRDAISPYAGMPH